MDDYVFPAYNSSKARSRHTIFGESKLHSRFDPECVLIFGILAGDAFIRELDVSRVTLRLNEKQDKKGDSDHDEHTIAKLHGNTIDVLQRCLVSRLVLPQTAPTDGVFAVQTHGASPKGCRGYC